MKWLLQGPLPIDELCILVRSYVPHFQGLQFDAVRTLDPVDTIAALSDTTVVWSQGKRVFAWRPAHTERTEHTEHWLVGQVMDSHIMHLVALSATNFILMTPRCTLQEWHVSLGRLRFVDVSGSPRQLALLSNAELAISYCDESIGVWNAATDTHRTLVPASHSRSWSGYIQSFVWSPPVTYGDMWCCLMGLPDHRLAAGTRKGMVFIFDALAGSCLRSCNLQENVTALAWSTHSTCLLISTPRKVVEWNLFQSDLKALPCRGTKHMLALEDGAVIGVDPESSGETMQSDKDLIRQTLTACQGADCREFASGYFFGLANLGHSRIAVASAGGLVALA